MKKPECAPRRARWWSAAIAPLVSMLCATGCALDDESSADSAEVQQPETLAIYGGSPAPGVGVVAITMADGYECSGVLIHQNAVITAAHCLRSSGVGAGQTRDVQASVVFTKKDGRVVCLTDHDPVTFHPPRDPRCARLATYRASVHPNAATSYAPGDLAILVRDTQFVNTTLDEYAYIQLSNPSTDRLEFHGYGYFNDSRKTGGSARSGSAPVRQVGELSIRVAGQSMRVCKGDSGGPLTELYANTAPLLVVAGISSWVGDGFNGCPGKDKDAYFTRVGQNLGYIERWLNRTCDRVNVRVGSETRIAARCFLVANSPAPRWPR